MQARRIWKALVGLALAAGVAQVAFAADLVITDAQWKPENSVLRIEGTSTHPDEVVLVRDAKSRALLGSAAVRADGKWRLKIRNPSSVPTRMSAELGRECVNCDVTRVGPVAAK
jgi:hypothetical protein